MTMRNWSGEAVSLEMRLKIAEGRQFLKDFTAKLPKKVKKRKPKYDLPNTGQVLVLVKCRNKYTLYHTLSNRVSEYDLEGMPKNKHEITEVKGLWLNKLRKYVIINGVEHIPVKL